MEFFDVVDELGRPTGDTVERSEAHAKGIRHRTAHIWIVRKFEGKYQVLLQKRAAHKDSFPGCYDTSSSGHIMAGDEPKESAKRELYEELGIEASDDDLIDAGYFVINYEKTFYGKRFKDREIAFVFIYAKEVDIDKLVYQESEVENAKWFDVDYVESILEPRDSRFCVPKEGFSIARQWCLER